MPEASTLFSTDRWSKDERVKTNVVEPLLTYAKKELGLSCRTGDSSRVTIEESPDLVLRNDKQFLLIDFKESKFSYVSFDAIAEAKATLKTYERKGRDVRLLLIGPFEVPIRARELAERNHIWAIGIPRRMAARKLPEFLRSELDKFAHRARDVAKFVSSGSMTQS